MCVSIALAEVKLGFWILNLIVPMTSLSFLHEIEHVCLYRIGEVNWVLDFDCHLPISFFPSQTAAAAAAASFFFFFFFYQF